MKVRKIVPVSIYDIIGIEQWLEAMADQGLKAESLGSWAVFTRDGKPGTRYRLEPYKDETLYGTPAPAKLELYEESGWEHAFTIAKIYDVFYTEDRRAPELYSDLETRGFSLDYLAKQVDGAKKRQRIFWGIAAIVLLAALFRPTSEWDVQPDRWARLPVLLLSFTNPGLLFFAIIAVFSGLRSWRDNKTLMRFHEALHAGVAPPPSKGPQKSIVVENIAQLILVPVLIVCLIPFWSNLIPGGKNSLDFQQVPTAEFQQPYVALQELEREPLYTYEELFQEDYKYSKERNVATSNCSILAPVWYETCQYLHSAQSGSQSNGFSPNPQDGKYRYSPSLDMTRFELTFGGLARPVAEAQMDLYRAINVYWTYEELRHPEADFIVHANEEKGVHQMMAIGRGRQVAVFHYGGQEDLADHLDLLVNMVNQ